MVAAIAGVAAAGSIASGAISSSASSSASKAQTSADQQAQALQQQRFEETRGDLQPFLQVGTAGRAAILGLTGTNLDADGNLQGNPLASPLGQAYSGTAPTWDPTISGLEQTPGYQFTRDQGLKAAQNGFAAKGLASSGAAMKGAVDYAGGLASTTYQQQFGNYLSNFQNYMAQRQMFNSEKQQTFNMYDTLMNNGQNAAAQLGAQGQANTNSQSQLLAAAGASQAAGQVGSANAISGGVAGVGNALQQYQLLSQSGLLGSTGNAVAASGIFDGAGVDARTMPSSRGFD